MKRRTPRSPLGRAPGSSSRLVGRIAWLAVVALLCGCKTSFDEPGGLVVYDGGPGGGPDGSIRPTRPVPHGAITPVYGFVSASARVEYYYLGEVDVGDDGKVGVNPIYFFYDEAGEPLFRVSDDGSQLVGWHPVVGVVPTKKGYSPFWRVHRVTVKGAVNGAQLDELAKLPDKAECQMDALCSSGQRCIEQRCRDPIKVGDYQLDAIKSRETLDDSELTIARTEIVLNCPVVEANAQLTKGIANPDLAIPKVQLWFERLRAFCFLMEGAKQLLGAGLGALSLDDDRPKVNDAYFIRQQLRFGNKTVSVMPARTLVLTEKLPGSKGYSPLVRESTVIVDKDYEFKDLTSVAQARQKKLSIKKTNRLHDLVVRGTIPKCTTDDDCAKTGGKVDPPLKCSVEQGYCSPPFARFGEECRRGVKECDPHGGPDGSALACVGLLVRDKYFCFNACDSSKPDENDDRDIDSRCGNAPNTRCYALRQTDPTRPNGVCIERCNSLAGDAKALRAECEHDTCGDGKLDYNETCDDGNRKNGDGCNEHCSLSTFERCDSQADCKVAGQTCKTPTSKQKNTYCLPVAKKEKDESEDDGKYRTTCMEFDYCWPPDDRADWLGKKDDESK